MTVAAFTAKQIFDGEQMLTQHAVVIDGKHIAKVVALRDAGNLHPVNLGEGTLAPGFIDVQVNGGGGALLNAPPTANTVINIAQAHRKFGTVGMMPTVITDKPEIITRAIAAVAEAQKQGAASVLGIHVEGPHLDIARKGAHDPTLIRPMTDADIAELAQNICGTTMVTVAPNRVTPEQIYKLVAAGVKVSLGHSDATYEETRAAVQSGASAFTHLFNAMSQVTPRDPGMVGAAVTEAKTFASLIADGFHVHDVNLKLAIRAKGIDHIMLITDAMPTAAGGPDTFALQGRLARRDKGRLTLEDGTLAGSDLTMDQALRYVVQKLDKPLPNALRMASLTPATFLKHDHELGRIRKGYRASLVYLDTALHVKHVWVDGR
jgi:N-acetylglucosamine-6-phosphate deacetylase